MLAKVWVQDSSTIATTAVPSNGDSVSEQSKEQPMSTWLPSLKTGTPEEGYALAVKMARVAVKLTQPDESVRDRLRAVYAEDADALIAISQVVATHFATVATANNYWRDAP
jgi:hypothetical protein